MTIFGRVFKFTSVEDFQFNGGIHVSRLLHEHSGACTILNSYYNTMIQAIFLEMLWKISYPFQNFLRRAFDIIWESWTKLETFRASTLHKKTLKNIWKISLRNPCSLRMPKNAVSFDNLDIPTFVPENVRVAFGHQGSNLITSSSVHPCIKTLIGLTGQICM